MAPAAAATSPSARAGSPRTSTRPPQPSPSGPGRGGCREGPRATERDRPFERDHRPEEPEGHQDSVLFGGRREQGRHGQAQQDETAPQSREQTDESGDEQRKPGARDRRQRAPTGRHGCVGGARRGHHPNACFVSSAIISGVQAGSWVMTTSTRSTAPPASSTRRTSSVMYSPRGHAGVVVVSTTAATRLLTSRP